MTRAHRRALAGTCAAVLLGVGAAWAAGFRLNVTPSMPPGLWRAAGSAELHRGDAVVLCLPNPAGVQMAQERGYIGAGPCPSGAEPLIKPVAAIAGDRVTVVPDGVVVNGAALPGTAQLARDTAGRPLPAWPSGTYAVRPSEVWVIANRVPNSWDSRYWGPIPVSSVIGAAYPVAVLP